jgi:ADP-ribose pyrophosphatase YjhB (NUDIX family)
MMPRPVTDALIHDLTVGSHAQGTTQLAVAILVADDEQILLVDHGSGCDLPGGLVLPGETLDNAAYRTAAGVVTIDLTGYLGHHDQLTDSGVLRTFIFAATTPHLRDPTSLSTPHRWVTHHDLPHDLDPDLANAITLAASWQ